MHTEAEYIEEKLLKFAEAVSEEQRTEVFEVKVSGGKNRFRLKIVIDKKDGVTLDECAEFSRKVALLIEENNIIQSSYNIEVSSPGLDRPLVTARDFERVIGKLVRMNIKDKEGIDNQKSFLGKIVGIEADYVVMALENKTITIPLNNISKARLEIEIK
ncbi:MAG: ribosome maturation factor RimP [Nitrospiraceae bacterium]|nr:ribosome maturation factor RimP [Nitrospiraceae bacterium]